jgi:hypothetical protein
MVSVTIHGQRRAFRVSDLPLGDEGVAGYAVDIEEMEELSRTFRRSAMRSGRCSISFPPGWRSSMPSGS